MVETGEWASVTEMWKWMVLLEWEELFGQGGR